MCMLFKLFRLKFEIGCINLKMGCALMNTKPRTLYIILDFLIERRLMRQIF